MLPFLVPQTPNRANKKALPKERRMDRFAI